MGDARAMKRRTPNEPHALRGHAAHMLRALGGMTSGAPFPSVVILFRPLAGVGGRVMARSEADPNRPSGRHWMTPRSACASFRPGAAPSPPVSLAPSPIPPVSGLSPSTPSTLPPAALTLALPPVAAVVALCHVGPCLVVHLSAQLAW